MGKVRLAGSIAEHPNNSSSSKSNNNSKSSNKRLDAEYIICTEYWVFYIFDPDDGVCDAICILA
jgi:hypothetical protein